MKRLVLLTVVFLLALATTAFSAQINSSSDASLTGASIIGFDGTGQAEGYYGSLNIDGVTFSGDNGLLNLVTGPYAGNYNSTGIHLENPYTNGATSFTFSFSSSVSAFGFNFGASNEDWLLSAYDTSANLLESYLLPQTWWSNSGDFFGLAVDNIAFATLTQMSTNEEPHDWILLDNFTYASAAPVPEPATFLLLGSGLAGLAFYRRKRK